MRRSVGFVVQQLFGVNMNKWCLVDSEGNLCSCVFDSLEEAEELCIGLSERGTMECSVRRMIPVTKDQHRVIRMWGDVFPIIKKIFYPFYQEG